MFSGMFQSIPFYLISPSLPDPPLIPCISFFLLILFQHPTHLPPLAFPAMVGFAGHYCLPSEAPLTLLPAFPALPCLLLTLGIQMALQITLTRAVYLSARH